MILLIVTLSLSFSLLLFRFLFSIFCFSFLFSVPSVSLLPFPSFFPFHLAFRSLFLSFSIFSSPPLFPSFYFRHLFILFILTLFSSSPSLFSFYSLSFFSSSTPLPVPKIAIQTFFFPYLELIFTQLSKIFNANVILPRCFCQISIDGSNTRVVFSLIRFPFRSTCVFLCRLTFCSSPTPAQTQVNAYL